MSTDLLYQGPQPRSEVGLLVLYDLRHPEGRELALRAQAAWGKHRTDIHECGVNHVILNLRPGGAQEVLK